MGRALFIRVRAETYDEKDVLGAWPLLCGLVWPQTRPGAILPARKARAAVPAGQGALELADALPDLARFGDMPPAVKQALQTPASRLETLRQRLDDALGDRDVRAAQTVIDALEQTLDEAEKALDAIPGKFADALR
jgi:hypothetical protein